MSLQLKILVTVLIVFGLYGALDYTCQHTLVLPSFISLERSQAENSMRRCIAALKGEGSDLDRLAMKYAASEGIRRSVVDRNNSRVSNKLVAECFADEKVNLMYICDNSGEVVWGQVVDHESKQPRRIDLAAFPDCVWPETHPLLAHETVDDRITGIVVTEEGPMLIASRPIVTIDSEGAICGSVIMGRLLRGNVLNEIAEHVAVDVEVWAVADGSVPVEAKVALSHIEPASKFCVRELADELLHVYATVPDIQGVPALLMRVEKNRDVRLKGMTALVRSNFYSNLATGFFVLFLLWMLLRNIVVDPIRKLTRHVVEIANNNRLSSVPLAHRRDELGTLAREFDGMVEKLEESRKRLSEQSYHLGKAEVASGVLHNARNLLTPLVSRIYELQQELRGVPADKLETAQAELKETSLSVQRKEDLTKFIDLSTEGIAKSIAAAQDRLNDVAKIVAQIEEMLSEQGKFSQSELPVEELKLSDLIEDSIASLPDEICDGISIQIDPSAKTVEPILVHGITLLQVFNNLLINAAESIRQAGSTLGRICIRAGTEEVDGTDMVHVKISDNGEGVEQESIARIFERGYSTRPNMPSGIGLHWCANTIAMMNGKMYAESEGLGHGACLHVQFPARQERMTVLANESGAKS
jgi:signal transduction histidine kinase